MTLQGLAEKVVVYLAKHSGKRFTGQLIFTFDFRDGGIGNCGVEIKQREKNPFQEKGVSEENKNSVF